MTRLLGRGDGILITPNHASQADAGVIYDLSHQVGRPFCYMAAYQIFADPYGFRRYMLPRLGVFPVDREGSDRAALQASLDVLTGGKYPLVIFPEGAIYYMADRLTPLREGAAALAVSAAQRLADQDRTVWIVPAALKYHYLDGHDPLPAFMRVMEDLERFFTWSSQAHRPLLERVYRYAEAMLALKEFEYFDEVRSGPLKERIALMTNQLLDGLEDRWLGRHYDAEPVPVRVKNLRRACVKVRLDPAADPERKDQAGRDLDALFVCIQAFSYPGDYLRACPTVERLAEVLNKFEMDIFGVTHADPRASRRAQLRIGEPIDVRTVLGGVEGHPRARDAADRLTMVLEERIQGMLDAMGPGRPLPPEAGGAVADAAIVDAPAS